MHTPKAVADTISCIDFDLDVEVEMSFDVGNPLSLAMSPFVSTLEQTVVVRRRGLCNALA